MNCIMTMENVQRERESDNFNLWGLERTDMITTDETDEAGLS